MVQYRRHYVPGGTYFFTVALRDRRSDLLVARVEDLRASFRHVLEKHPFHIDAIVILPDHIHAIWTLPADDTDFSGRWRALKSCFVRRIRREEVPIGMNSRGEALLWQRRFWEHWIRDETDYRHHVDYIHYNPVRHGYVATPRQWPYSSFHRFVARGDLAPDWASRPDETFAASCGEPS